MMGTVRSPTVKTAEKPVKINQKRETKPHARVHYEVWCNLSLMTVTVSFGQEQANVDQEGIAWGVNDPKNRRRSIARTTPYRWF
jgi:hypothetical protein